MSGRPWPPGTVTGIGSLPGTDPVEAVAMVMGELPDLPHLVELPQRGAGADMIGRTAALLVDLPVQIEPSGWRFAAHAGREQRRARDFLRRDLDALEQGAQGYAGALKVEVVGPVTLAASIELLSGHRALMDHGALHDVAESLAAGVRAHLADVQERLPQASLVVQLDEPSVPAALAAMIPTASGYGTLPALDPILARTTVGTVLQAMPPTASTVVHCCASDAPLRLFVEAGADAVAFDLNTFRTADLDAAGQLIDDGAGIWLGVLDPMAAASSPAGPGKAAAALAERARNWWSTLGFSPQSLAEQVVLTPGCGLVGTTPELARRAYADLREAGRRLVEA